MNCPECHCRPRWNGDLSHSPNCSRIDLDTAKWYAQRHHDNWVKTNVRIGSFVEKSERWRGKFLVVCQENNKLRAANSALRDERDSLKMQVATMVPAEQVVALWEVRLAVLDYLKITDTEYALAEWPDSTKAYKPEFNRLLRALHATMRKEAT